jgi:hypothetical protein
MNLFRSEEHIARWLDGRDPGETITVSQLSALAQAWWYDRLDPGWRPHSPAQNQAILEQAGLIGPFWSLSVRQESGETAPSG